MNVNWGVSRIAIGELGYHVWRSEDADELLAHRDGDRSVEPQLHRSGSGLVHSVLVRRDRVR